VNQDTTAVPAARQGLHAVDCYRVLLVEDDAGDALLVEEYLADTGLPHVLRWKRDLATALADIAVNPPDCVLLDLGLPDIVGVAAVEAIQAASPRSAVIVLTGLDEARSAGAAVASGAQDYLVKGQVSTDLLDRTLRYAVHRKQAERAAAELRENQIHARENARLERGLLPTPLLHSAGVTVNSRYLPGRERALLGGDFLDVVQTSDGAVHAVIGDVSGHGPDEAALGVCLRITWRALVLAGHTGVELLDLLEQVLVAERPRVEMFATCTTVTSPAAASAGRTPRAAALRGRRRRRGHRGVRPGPRHHAGAVPMAAHHARPARRRRADAVHRRPDRGPQRPRL
jgi:DNA-binding NarL/FixJ family response regulator